MKRTIALVLAILAIFLVSCKKSEDKKEGAAQSGRLVPAKRSIYLVDEHHKELGEEKYTAVYEWKENECTISINDIPSSVHSSSSVIDDNTMERITTIKKGTMRFSFKYDPRNGLLTLKTSFTETSNDVTSETFHVDHPVGSSGSKGFLYEGFDADLYMKNGIIERMILYADNTEYNMNLNYDEKDKIAFYVTYADSMDSVDNENLMNITVNRQNKTAVMFFPDSQAESPEDNGERFVYSDGGYVWEDKQMTTEFADGGSLKKLADNNGHGIIDTEYTEGYLSEAWQRIADNFIFDFFVMSDMDFAISSVTLGAYLSSSK